MLVVALAVFGRKLSLKHYERNRLHTQRARAYREDLEKLFDVKHYKALRDEALKTHWNHWITLTSYLEDHPRENNSDAKHEANEKGVYIAKTQIEIRLAHLHNSSAFMYWARMYSFLVGLGAAMAIIPLIFGLYPILEHLGFVPSFCK